MQARQRYEGLDHLRGVLAITVMIYHFLRWSSYGDMLHFTVQRPINLLGLYAVSTFYCLSGSALYIVYRSRQLDRGFFYEFAVKRSFRIIPLFWAATTASLVLAGFAAVHEEPLRVFLSYSLLFSWLDPAAYFTVGAWSIGNEWAFYTLFPFLLWAWKSKISRRLVLMATLAVAVYYSFGVMDSAKSVSDQWSLYIDPLNQLPLFVGGILVGAHIVERPRPRAGFPILLLASVVFVAISYAFDTQFCIGGLPRLFLVGVALAWCYGAGMVKPGEGRIARFLDWAGRLSYSVYLLHPIVYQLTSKVLFKTLQWMPDFATKAQLRVALTFSLGLLATLIVSHLSFALLERPLMKLGRSLLSKKPTKTTLTSSVPQRSETG